MVKIPDFEVEQWMDAYENTPGVLNIAETCASSVSLKELTSFHHDAQAGAHDDEAAAAAILDYSARMTYGAIRGSEELRRNIAALYADDGGETEALTPDDVLVTQGAIAANHLVFYALVGPGDHVICVYPTYQQLYTVPATLGAEVSLWEQRAEDNYQPDIRELEKLIRPNTKMIVINNPNNPTGTTIPKATLKAIRAKAKAANITILSDEAYSPLYHSPAAESAPQPPSLLSLRADADADADNDDDDNDDDNVIATSTMSKAWALAGIRVGWAATRNKRLAARLAAARDYTTISVSQLDDRVARYALSSSVRPGLAARNLGLARTNLALLAAFVEAHARVCSWVAPTAGTTAFLRFCRAGGGDGGGGRGGQVVDDVWFCREVLARTSVLMVPGSRCFGEGFAGFVRVGYVCSSEVLLEALRRLGEFVEEVLG
ncbi:PLP-dependent transferase [Xylaria intraflava]|nr:PLP-dependent transferase [Xylaria intraflava]